MRVFSRWKGGGGCAAPGRPGDGPRRRSAPAPGDGGQRQALGPADPRHCPSVIPAYDVAYSFLGKLRNWLRGWPWSGLPEIIGLSTEKVKSDGLASRAGEKNGGDLATGVALSKRGHGHAWPVGCCSAIGRNDQKGVSKFRHPLSPWIPAVN